MNILTVNTITYRGIVCIDTFPLELVWAKPNTVLECNNCLAYATFKNVLVGLCKNCALYSYNGKYGNGFFKYPYSDNDDIELSYCFGNIKPLHILNIKGIEYSQTALNNNDTYSIYNLSLSSNNELSLLFNETFNIYGLYNFQSYYNCDVEVLHMIIDKVKEHKNTFTIWSSKYYNDCLTIENFYKVNKENYQIQEETNNYDKYICSYCNIYKLKKELKKCGRCFTARYCSIACQSRDWYRDHKLFCSQILTSTELDTMRYLHLGNSQNLETNTQTNSNSNSNNDNKNDSYNYSDSDSNSDSDNCSDRFTYTF